MRKTGVVTERTEEPRYWGERPKLNKRMDRDQGAHTVSLMHLREKEMERKQEKIKVEEELSEDFQKVRKSERLPLHGKVGAAYAENTHKKKSKQKYKKIEMVKSQTK
jgi:hypothetical protein